MAQIKCAKGYAQDLIIPVRLKTYGSQCLFLTSNRNHTPASDGSPASSPCGRGSRTARTDFVGARSDENYSGPPAPNAKIPGNR
jgi:hypothetical protein